MDQNKKYDNEVAVSVIIGTLLLILVVTIGTLAIATFVASVNKDTTKQVSVSQSVAASGVTIYVGGTDNTQILTESLAAAYYEKNPGYKVSFSVIPPERVYPAMKSRTMDIGAISGYIKLKDITHSPDLLTQEIGDSAVVVITNKNYPGVISLSNPIQYNDLKTFFTGAGRTGNILNGPQFAQLVTRSADPSPTTDTFYNYFGIVFPTPLATSLKSDSDLISYVSATPYAIGYADYSDVQSAIINHNAGIRIVAIDDGSHTYSDFTYDTVEIAAKYKYLSTQVHSDGTPFWVGNQTDVTGYNLSLIYPINYVVQAYPGSESGFLDFATSPMSIPAYKSAYVFPVSGF